MSLSDDGCSSGRRNDCLAFVDNSFASPKFVDIEDRVEDHRIDIANGGHQVCHHNALGREGEGGGMKRDKPREDSHEKIWP